MGHYFPFRYSIFFLFFLTSQVFTSIFLNEYHTPMTQGLSQASTGLRKCVLLSMSYTSLRGAGGTDNVLMFPPRTGAQRTKVRGEGADPGCTRFSPCLQRLLREI